MDPFLILNLLHLGASIVDSAVKAQQPSEIETAAAALMNHDNDSLEQLRQRLDRLSLVNAAMWTLLADKLCITEEQLVARIREIDLQDGALDGRKRHTLRECPTCHRPLSASLNKCLYCGYTPPADEMAVEIVTGDVKIVGESE